MRLRLVPLLVASLSVLIVTSNGCAQVMATESASTNLRGYRERDMLNYLKGFGYRQPILGAVWANSSGTRVFVTESPPDKENGLVWMISADADEVRKRERPAQIAFINDEGNFVAWTNDLAQGLVTTEEKMIPVPEFDFTSVSADQSGTYLCLSNARSGDTRLFAIAEPEQNLIRFSSDFHVTAIARKPAEIWMIGHRVGQHQRWQGEVWLFRHNGVEWAKASQAILPDNFNVSKVDPYGDWCLLYEVTDMPWRRFLLFNPTTGARGPTRGAEVFLFLKEDFLSSRLRR